MMRKYIDEINEIWIKIVGHVFIQLNRIVLQIQPLLYMWPWPTKPVIRVNFVKLIYTES